MRYHRHGHGPTTIRLAFPYVVFHGPHIAARIVYYPDSAPILYEPGYCPSAAHYHPYVPSPGWHGSFSIQVGF